MSLKESFAKFGVKLKHSRQSWSGRSEDGETVVLTLWKPHFTGKPMEYHGFRRSDADDAWIKSWGNRERLENLIWAVDRCDGLFRVVVVEPKDSEAARWEIGASWPIETTMRITDLNRQTGEFHAVVA